MAQWTHLLLIISSPKMSSSEWPFPLNTFVSQHSGEGSLPDYDSTWAPNTHQRWIWLSMWEAAGGRSVLVLRAQGCAAVSHYISNVAGMLWAEVSRKLMAHGQQHFFKMFLIMLLSREAKLQYVYLCRFRVFLVSCLSLSAVHSLSIM